MTLTEPTTQFGDFTAFGFSRDPRRFSEHHLADRLGLSPKIIDFGSFGHFFFYTSYGQVAESEESIALKLGFVRSPTKSPLTAQQLLAQKIVAPGTIDINAFRGNALVACLSKTDPVFSVFKTPIAIPQLYYSTSSGSDIICSDRLNCLLSMLDQVELNEDVLPMHFLFRSTPGASTYFRNVQRMLPGQLLKWTSGDLNIKLVKDLRFADNSLSFNRNDDRALDTLNETLRDVIGDYVGQIEASGQSLANLLSGGVDSSLIQHLINVHSSGPALRSFSFAAQAPSFEFEIENARQASQLFHTKHTFVEFHPEDYPRLLTETIDVLAQPPALATEPAMLAVAEYLQERDVPTRYFFSGQGADGFFGLEGAKKLKGLNYVRRVPGAASALKGLGILLKPVTTYSRILLKGSDILASAEDPHAFVSPTNTVAVYVDLDLVRRCFGDHAVSEALEYRREIAAQYLHSHHYLENVHIIDLLTDSYEVDVQRHQLFLAHHREQVHPFFDEDILRVGLAFHPDVRYMKRFRNKHLLKTILEQQTGSPSVRKPKGFSIFEEDWISWMRSGPLRPLVQDIQLPGFLSRADYEKAVERPGFFLWGLLILDIFQKRILDGHSTISTEEEPSSLC